MVRGMKTFLVIFLGALTCSAADEFGTDEIPYGVEVLTGYRSSYVDRGFRLSQDLIEVQFSGELALSDHWMTEWGGWYGSETGSGNFEQISGFFALRRDFDEWSSGFNATWSSYQHPVFQDGVNFGPFLDWSPNRDWRVGGKLSYDTGADGWHGQVEAEWSPVTGENSYLSVLTSLGVADDFYGGSGLHDLQARVGWTYQVNRHVAVTPFVGASIGLDSVAQDSIFSGLWFAVNF